MWRDFFSHIETVALGPFCSICKIYKGIYENRICQECYESLEKARSHREPKFLNDYSARFFATPQTMNFLYYLEKNSRLDKALKQMKYEGNWRHAIYFGEQLAEKWLRRKSLDAIIPVPLHPKKEKKRGYNQSFYIAQGIQKIIKKPILANVLKREIHTESQTKKNRIDRINTMRDAFIVHQKNKLNRKKILLVDDIITTGSTINGCLRALSKTQYKEVHIGNHCHTRSIQINPKLLHIIRVNP